MKPFFYILFSTIRLAFSLVELAFFVYAIMSWFPPRDGKEGPFRLFLGTVTEFFVAPVRAFLSRFEWVRRTPLDISFLVTWLLLSFLSALIPVVIL